MEEIRFHFEGALSEAHHLNFYEAARFQYAAARLVTKLMQFQRDGKFNKRITDRTNTDALLATHQDGSFDISILVPFAMAAAETFVTVPVGSLMSYVFERVLGKTSDSEVVDALNAQVRIAKEFGRINDNDSATVQQALQIIERQRDDLTSAHDQYSKHLERRIAELERERLLDAQQDQLKKIDGARVRIHSQNMTTAANAQADRKTFGHRS